MTDSTSHAPCATLARQISRLNDEIRLLTREIPLREGSLLELELQASQNESAAHKIAEEIRLRRAQLAMAETDLVALEQFFEANCKEDVT